MRIYVASYSPADDLAAGGGFQWRHHYEEAATIVCGWLDHPPIHNLALVTLDVPDGLTGDETTDWIDAHINLIEPPGIRALK